jgi:hypothetical protein
MIAAPSLVSGARIGRWRACGLRGGACTLGEGHPYPEVFVHATPCPRCSALIPSGAAFCPACGAPAGAGAPGLSGNPAAKWIGAALAVLLLLFIISTARERDEERREIAAHPAVATWVSDFPDLGQIRRVEDLPEWAEGTRQRVVTDRGEYLFYLKGGRVVTVYEDGPDGRREFWRDHQAD